MGFFVGYAELYGPGPPNRGVAMGEYPYVVVRYMATVYGRFPVRFTDPQETEGDSTADRNAFVVACALPFVDDRLTAQAREFCISVVQLAVRQSRYRMCVVFGKSDCVYCEPDGSSKESVEPPSGGIKGIRFPLRFRRFSTEGGNDG